MDKAAEGFARKAGVALMLWLLSRSRVWRELLLVYRREVPTQRQWSLILLPGLFGHPGFQADALGSLPR